MSIGRRICFMAAALWTASMLIAQQSGVYVERAGPYSIHYSMVPVRLLPAEVKRRHSLPDTGAALLNVAVRRGESSLAAEITAVVSTPAAESLDIDMRRVEENDLISYAGVVDLLDSQVLHVEMTIVPQGSLEPIKVAFEEAYPAP